MKLLSQLAICLALAGLTPFSNALLAQTPKAKLADELEDDLLKDLPKAKETTTPRDKPARPALPKDSERKLLQDLEGGEDVGLPPENPLVRIGQRMKLVGERIAVKDTSEETQSAQKEILADLAKLIEQTKKQCNCGSGKPGSGKGSAQAGAGTGEARPGPAREATDRVGKSESEKPESADVKDVLRRFWGHLPEKMREQMQAQLSEQFLPKYEKLIEEYYKRLAEERTGK